MVDDDDIGMNPSANWSAMNSCFLKAGLPDTLSSRVVHGHVSKVMAGASLATSVVGQSHHLTMVGGAAVLGVGTAGMGLAIAGGAMTMIGIGTSAVSLFKTTAHIDALKYLQQLGSMKDKCRCEARDFASQMTDDHDMIFTTILPYIIRQKREKQGMGVADLSLLTIAPRRSSRLQIGGRNEGQEALVLRGGAGSACHNARMQADRGDRVRTLYRQDYYAIRAMRSDQAAVLIAAKMKSA